MTITALLTGKDKYSFKNKNKLKILNKYIFNYSVLEVIKIKEINNYFTSSDSKLILKETKKLGFKSIKRPKSLSTNKSKHVDVLKHAVKLLHKKKIYPSIIIVLLANAPIIKAKWIRECIKILKKDKSATAVVPVMKINDHHPERAKKNVNGYLKNFIEGKKISSNRQDLTSCFFLCHNFWAIRVEEISKNNGQLPWSFMGKKVKPYLIKNSIDIHNQVDLEYAKVLLKNEKFI